MAEIRFSDNYNDISRRHGTDSGFQFEFFCERCNDTWRTEFIPYRTAQASGWLSKAAGVFGGIIGGTVGDAVEGVAEAGWSSAHDKAFAEAIEKAKQHFHRCPRCLQYVCGPCWHRDKGLCRNCAPSAEVEVEAARAEGEVEAAREKGREEGNRCGARIETGRDRQLVCPDCGHETEGAKFCPHCGRKLATKNQCPSCNTQVSPGTKFCPECGSKIQ